MNKIIYLFAAVFFISSCKKYDPDLAGPVLFEIIGSDGKSLVHSQGDSVKITYTDGNTVKSYNLSIMKLYTTDTVTLSSSYNGIYLSDNAVMSSLSNRNPNPIHNFNIFLDGINLGVIYLDYRQYVKAFPNPSSNLTFKGEEVMGNAIGFAGGAYDLNLLPVKIYTQ